MTSAALALVLSYLGSIYEGDTLLRLRAALLDLTGLEDPGVVAPRRISYEALQGELSAFNERESIRRSKGVYYTPEDVVRFILSATVRAALGRLTPGNLCEEGLRGEEYKPFAAGMTVFDPTCGAGEFLLGALEMKFALLGGEATEAEIRRAVSTIHGNDINGESLVLTKLRLFLCALHRFGAERCLGLPEVMNGNFSARDFVTEGGDFKRKYELILGNPPYVEDSRCGLDLPERYGNIYANVLKNASALLTPGGAMGFVVPLSYAATPRMSGIRREMAKALPEQYLMSFSDRPDCLFNSVHQKLCILVGRRRGGPALYTSGYRYSYREERPKLFRGLEVIKNSFTETGFIPKLGTPTDEAIYKKLLNSGAPALGSLSAPGPGRAYLNMRATFWIKVFRTPHTGGEYREFTFRDQGRGDYFALLLSSSLFWWYWICVSDCWHITKKELMGFPAPQSADFTKAARLLGALEGRLEETKAYVGTKQTEYEYKHRKCLHEIWAIDDYVNSLYGLTAEEGEYIKNFSLRYRMSGGAK